MIPKANLDGRWAVYLLSNGARTYIGASTDVLRRLRQHNKELVGGARSTGRSRTKWKLMVYLHGFRTRSEAYRWEKLLKLRGGRGLDQRLAAFKLVSSRVCPPGRKNNKQYQVPDSLILVIQDSSIPL